MAFGNDEVLGTISYNQGEADAILHEIYSPDGVTDQFFNENPFMAMMSKDEDTPGRYFEQPVWAGYGQAQSRSWVANSSGTSVGGGFGGLQTSAGLSGEAPYTFLSPKVENAAVANISTKLILESQGKKGAFINMVTAIADNQMMGLINDTAFGLFRGSDCSRGQVGGSVAGTTLTLTNVADSINLQLGMFLEFASSSSGSTIRALASNNTSCQITALDWSSGIATVKWNGSGTQTLTANNVVVGDYIYRAGDKSLGFNGFSDWIPYSGVSSNDSFLTVNRSAQATLLAGSYMDCTQGNLAENLSRAANVVARLGGKLTHFIMPHSQLTALENSLQSQVQYVRVQPRDAVKSSVSFSGVEINAGNGKVTCVADRNCPANTICGVDINSWKLISAGKAVHVEENDGKVWLRSYNQNGMEIRFYSLANVVCKEPRNQINLRVTPVT